MKRCLLGFLCLFISLELFGQSLEGDRLALVAIYNATTSGAPDYSNDITGWDVPGTPGDSPCGWPGVTCEGGRVTRLDLSQNQVHGPIAPEIGNLTELKYLNFEGAGAEMFPWVGEIPVTLGNLTKLEYLNLRHNRIGIVNMGVIGALTNLKELAVTPLGEIPSEWASLTNLEVLYLGSGEAFGPSEKFTFPSFLTSFTKLRELYLIQQLSGTFPAQVAGLPNLEVLEIGGNHFLTGQIPTVIGNLSKLKKLSIWRNPLNGPIPAEIGSLVNLETLQLVDTPLSGGIPSEINNLTKLSRIEIGSTQLGGVFPSISNLTSLNHLDIRYNNFQGPLPSLANVPVSGYVNISSNAFTFAGLEGNISKLDGYASQANIPISANVDLGAGGVGVLYVEAGGTLSNNTYKWFKNGALIATNVGDQSLAVTEEALYRVEVTNSIVVGLKLVSNNYSFVKLPVTLIAFSGEKNGHQNNLNWQTSSEVSNRGFEIERSSDARTFETIGFVDGNGDTKEIHSYHFTDLAPLPTAYYRLKQLDHDGKFEYSKVIVVKTPQEPLRIYPNPAHTNITIAGYQGHPDISVFNHSGKLVLEDKNSRGHLNVRTLKNGIYTIQIGGESKKLLIQR